MCHFDAVVILPYSRLCSFYLERVLRIETSPFPNYKYLRRVPFHKLLRKSNFACCRNSTLCPPNVCAYVYVCVYACMHVCIYVCVYIYMYLCMCVCIHMCVCVRVHARARARVNVFLRLTVLSLLQGKIVMFLNYIFDRKSYTLKLLKERCVVCMQ
jgi:hypothetical protein